MNQHGPRFRIGQLAQRLGLNVRTLRYYEALGLLPAPSRMESGYRFYSEDDERLLRFILQAKRLGFQLTEIRQIVQAGHEGSPCDHVREALSRRIGALDGQIADLLLLRAELAAAIARGQGATSTERGLCGLIEEWSSSRQIASREDCMTNRKRHVEVFTAGCPVCEPVVELVQRIACPSCDISIYNVRDDPQGAARAKAAKVQRLPLVLVDGIPADCCQSGPVTEAGLRAAGVGGN